MLTELGETGVCSWAVYSQYSSPGSPKLYTYRPSYILLFHSNQKITVLKRCSPSTVPPEFGTLQPEPETSLGLFHTILCQGTVQSPLRTRSTVPRRKDFQAAFVSGNSPRVYFPKEALPGECWGLKSSHVLLQRFVVLFMWRLYCVWKNIPVGLGFHMLDSSFFFLFFFSSFPYVSLDMRPLFKVAG